MKDYNDWVEAYWWAHLEEWEAYWYDYPVGDATLCGYCGA